MNTSLAIFILAVQFVFLLCMTGLVLYAGYIFWTLRREVPYVPTPYHVIRRMMEVARLTPVDCVIDCGAGTGRIVLEVARRYAIDVVGVERSSMLLGAARLRQLVTRRRGKVTWVHGDFMRYPLQDRTVVFCFLTTPALVRLAPKLSSLSAGSRVISYKFRIPSFLGWKETLVPVGRGDRFYCYTKEAECAILK